jgi:hypothetical protein
LDASPPRTGCCSDAAIAVIRDFVPHVATGCPVAGPCRELALDHVLDLPERQGHGMPLERLGRADVAADVERR